MKDLHRNLLIIGIIIFLDQLTKFLALSRIILFDIGFFGFTLVKNTGASFGMLQGSNMFLIWISIIALGLIMYYYYSTPKTSRVALVVVSAGILGNLIDRVSLGHVVDFVNFKFWPVFNIADSCIVLGVAFLLYDNLRGK